MHPLLANLLLDTFASFLKGSCHTYAGPYNARCATGCPKSRPGEGIVLHTVQVC